MVGCCRDSIDLKATKNEESVEISSQRNEGAGRQARSRGQPWAVDEPGAELLRGEDVMRRTPRGLITVNDWNLQRLSNTEEIGTFPINLNTSKQLRIDRDRTVATDTQ